MSSAGELQRVDTVAAALRDRLGERVTEARLAIVLGSGLKGFARHVEDGIEVPFTEIEHAPCPKVEGHGGAIVAGRVAGTRIVCVTGRVHLYEGWQPAEVVRIARALRRAGVPGFLLTNAAGGAADGMRPGDLMAITDHLNLTGSTPLAGDHVAEFGPRFPDQSSVYTGRLGALLQECAAARGTAIRTGVYAGLLGPSYETPAEVRMCRALGADAIGMSTVHEAMALNAMAADVAGLSLITNAAAGLGESALSHDEVVAAGKAAEAKLEALVTEFCARQ
ncbi:MAG: purine-nucleoside phosphorylase [bacterium]|nr:purine-nucleoside phosphorylase [bacterium]